MQAWPSVCARSWQSTYMSCVLGLVVAVVGTQLWQDLEASKWLQPSVATQMRWRASCKLKLREWCPGLGLQQA